MTKPLSATDRRVCKVGARLLRRAGVTETLLAMPRIAETVRSRDPLETRAMWRRQGRALLVRASTVGGATRRFLAP
jgi:hypothetical protein